ncbi:hypothetical protein ACP70R_029044 [Stipagrostis hirtigluma subsp. patula]
MEGKRAVAAAAICCLLIGVLLSGQPQQVAAMSKFCRCYKACYTECRKENVNPRYVCKFGCLEDCINGGYPPNPPKAPNCGAICVTSICGVMAIAPTDVEACVADCTKNIGAFAPPSDGKIN